MIHTATALRATVLALVMTAATGVTHAVAFGTPTYLVYVAGPNGGTIQASGDALPMPDGACGMRLLSNNVLAWYWAAGEVVPDGELNVLNNGWMPPANQLTELIEFTGAFGDACAGPYVFHTPATPTGQVPPGAVALVVQFVEPGDVEFLDDNFAPFEPPDMPEPPEPPDPGDICESVPEFCDIPDSFVDDPCESHFWSDICSSAGAVGAGLLGLGRVVEPRVLGLAALSGATSDAEILRTALARTDRALAIARMATPARDRLLKQAMGRLSSRYALESLSRLAVSPELGTHALLNCRASLYTALKAAASRLTFASRDTLDVDSRRARTICDAASLALSDANEAAGMVRLAIRGE